MGSSPTWGSLTPERTRTGGNELIRVACRNRSDASGMNRRIGPVSFGRPISTLELAANMWSTSGSATSHVVYFGAAGGAPEATRTRWNEIFRSLLYNNEMV